MSLNLPCYKDYKSAKNAFIGRLPGSWAETSIKYGYRIVLGKMLQTEPKSEHDELKRYLRAANIGKKGVDVGDVKQMWFSPVEIISLRLKENDVLISEGGDVGRSAIWRGEGGELYFQNAINRARPLDDCLPEFLYYWMIFVKGSGYIDIICNKSTIAHYTAEKVAATPLLKPSLEEQKTIARFLDHETTKIDELIAKQERLIELLKEKRQAVISHAVTKGLNPDVPMKDSGVEWLGEVPEHWSVQHLKQLAVLQSGIAKGRAVSDEAISVPMLRVANVQAGYIKLDDVHEIFIEPAELSRYALRAGDVLMNEGGDNDKLGRGAVWQGEINPCIHQNHVFAIRPHSVEPEWLTAVTSAEYARFHFYRVAKQSTNLASISSSNIKETPVTVPPAPERAAILEYVEKITLKIDRALIVGAKQIELLKERRTALISAAVTGKIDVRNWKPNAV